MPTTSSEPLESFGCDEDICVVEALPELIDGPSLWEDPSGEFVAVQRAAVEESNGNTSSASSSPVRDDPAAPIKDFVYGALELTSSSREIRYVTVRRSQLLEDSSLRPRDLRAVVLEPLPGSDTNTVVRPRRESLLACLGSVRAIVRKDRALLFGNGSNERSRFLRIHANQRQESENATFVMCFLESALLSLQRLLDARLLNIRKVVEPILQKPVGLQETTLEEVRQQRRSLLRCRDQAASVSSLLLTRADNGDTVKLAEVDGSDASEWDGLLEVYLQAYGEIARECERLLGDIEDFEESTNLKLQSRRLRIEEFELSLVITSVSVGSAALLPGIFGMNLLTGIENEEGMFQLATFGSLSIGLSFFLGLRHLADKQDLFRRPPKPDE